VEIMKAAARDAFLSPNSSVNLPAGVDPCGENGEFHTYACRGPMFHASAALGLVRVPCRTIEVLIAVSILVSATHAFRPGVKG
jgi:diphthamide synthase (EF-2-diphthine--ammonia ligase)